MATVISSPYSGLLLDLDNVPNYDNTVQRSGKHDPITHEPLDKAALASMNMGHAFSHDNTKALVMAQYEKHVGNIEAQATKAV